MTMFLLRWTSGRIQCAKPQYIRTRKIKVSKADCLIGKRNKFLKQGNTEQASILDAQIAQTIFKENRAKAFMFKKYMEPALFTKKKPTLPSSKFNHAGKLVTEPKYLVKLLGMEYGQIRLWKRQIYVEMSCITWLLISHCP